MPLSVVVVVVWFIINNIRMLYYLL